jgi:Cu/Ag efflux pump CusA
MNLMRHALLVLLFLAMGAETAMAGRTQIVLQWLDTAHSSMDLRDIYKVEDALERVSNGMYVVDGHDVGGGTVNVFLYAEDSDVDAAVAVVIRFFEQGKLPKGMRIGRAIYEDEKRRNWHFQPAYPPGLAEFQIMYSRRTVPPKLKP